MPWRSLAFLISLPVYIIPECLGRAHTHQLTPSDPKAALSGDQGRILLRGGTLGETQSLWSVCQEMVGLRLKPKTWSPTPVPVHTAWPSVVGPEQHSLVWGAAEMTTSELILMTYWRNRRKGTGSQDPGDKNLGIPWGRTELPWRQ